MLLTGHDEVLMDALKLYPEFLSICSKYFDIPEKIVEHLIRLGSHIPDFPKLEYSKEYELTKLEHVGKFEMIPMLLKVKDSTSFVHYFHRGLNSMFHSMYSYMYTEHSPHKLTRKILVRSAGLFDYITKLQKNTLRIQMFGMLLHMVVDSYSPSHTFRLTEEEKDAKKYYCKTDLVKLGEISEGMLVTFALKKHKSDKLWQDKHIQQYFKSRDNWEKWFEKHKEIILLLENQIRFDKILDKRGKKLVNVKPVSVDPDYPAIIDFQKTNYIKGQRHFLYDRVKRVKRLHLYDFAVRDIMNLLKIFTKSLEESATKDLVDYLNKYTFNMALSEPLKHSVQLDIFETYTCAQY